MSISSSQRILQIHRVQSDSEIKSTKGKSFCGAMFLGVKLILRLKVNRSQFQFHTVMVSVPNAVENATCSNQLHWEMTNALGWQNAHCTLWIICHDQLWLLNPKNICREYFTCCGFSSGGVLQISYWIVALIGVKQLTSCALFWAGTQILERHGWGIWASCLRLNWLLLFGRLVPAIHDSEHCLNRSFCKQVQGKQRFLAPSRSSFWRPR